MVAQAFAPTNLIALIGSASGLGAQNHGTEKGPEFLRLNGLAEFLQKHHHQADWAVILRSFKDEKKSTSLQREGVLPLLIPHLENLAKVVRESIGSHQFPVVIGGDHSMAVGNITGVIEAHNAQQSFGLIWIDAHMDAHTPQTSPSYAYHGMPVAALLGFGEISLTNLLFPGPKLKPEHIVLIGPRSYEREEEELLKELHVKIFYGDDVQKRGISRVIEEAIDIVSKNTQGFGVSIDLDAFDPTDAPGVGTPAQNGIKVQEFLPFLGSIRENPHFRFLEIAEFNPDLDRDHKTERIIQQILLQLLPRTEV